MNSQSIFAVLAVGTGVCLAMQSAANGKFREHLSSPLWAAFFSICGTIICATIAMIALRPSVPNPDALKSTSWWFWIGGPLGALIVLAGATLTPRLGDSSFLAFIIGGQMLCSAALDHFGAMGLTPRPITPVRFFGLVFVLGGAGMIWFSQYQSAAANRAMAANTATVEADPDLLPNPSSPAEGRP
ncbi:MAG: DMT family transporter [Gemmataceae bacterium]